MPSFGFGSPLMREKRRRANDDNYLTLTATTAAPGETITLARMECAGGSCDIFWGDGQNTTVAAGDATPKAHVYAAAGAYPIKVSNPKRIVGLRLDSGKISQLKTAQLVGNAITYFRIELVTNSMIDSAHMTAWNPSIFYCNSLGVGSVAFINTAHMTTWNSSTWVVYSLPAGSAITLDTADLATWNPVNFWCHTSPAGSTFTISPAPFLNWKATTALQLQNNALTQAQVDAVLAGLWAMFPARTGAAGTAQLDGTNAAPSGILQAANPPTTGKEYAFELVNDSQNINPTKKWAAVNINP